jgi:hypothetical protein
MRRTWKTLILGLTLALQAAGVRADAPRWCPPGSPFAADAAPVPPPAVRIRRPVPLTEGEQPPPPPPVQPAANAAAPPAPGPRFVRAQSPDGFARPEGSVPVAPVAPGAVPPPPPPPPPPTAGAGASESYLCGQVTNTSKGGIIEGAGNAVRGIGGVFAPANGRSLFQSDQCFPWMISPVSSPFFAEDPRALTELRPIFIFQSVPRSNDVFHGGNVGFFGLQGRLAVTERLSLVVNKLGLVWTDPRDTSDGVHRHIGFSELWLGPKYTIIRNDESRTLLAAGLTFQIPWGSDRVFQDTGNLTLAPYMSFAQNFLKTNLGSFNFMNTTGYALATDNRRTEYLYAQFHLDYDVLNLHKIYPLAEVNWTHYTRNGGVRDLSFEGNDLFNFGSRGIAGKNDLSLALGARYKFCEGIQLGTAFEIPLINRHGLDAFRWTIDMIFRY